MSAGALANSFSCLNRYQLEIETQRNEDAAVGCRGLNRTSWN